MNLKLKSSLFFKITFLTLFIVSSFYLSGCSQYEVGAEPVKNPLFKIKNNHQENDLVQIENKKQVLTLEMDDEPFKAKKTAPEKKVLDIVVAEKDLKSKNKSKYKWLKNSVIMTDINVIFDAEKNKLKVFGDAEFKGDSKFALKTGAPEFQISLCLSGHIRKDGVAVLRTDKELCKKQNDFYVAGRWYCLDPKLNSKTTCNSYFIEIFFKTKKYIYSSQWQKFTSELNSSHQAKPQSKPQPQTEAKQNPTLTPSPSPAVAPVTTPNVEPTSTSTSSDELSDIETRYTESSEDDEVEELSDEGEFVGGFLPVPNQEEGEVEYKILDEQTENVPPLKNIEPIITFTPVPLPIPVPVEPPPSQIKIETKPQQTFIPIQTPKPTLSPKPVIIHKPVLSPRPIFTPRPVSSPKPVLSPKPTINAKPTLTPKPTPTSSPLPASEAKQPQSQSQSRDTIDDKIIKAKPVTPINIFSLKDQSVGAPNRGSLAKAINLKVIASELLKQNQTVPFRLARAERLRYFTNSQTAEFVYNMGLELQKIDSSSTKRKIELGDLSAQYGGFVSGHKSHQNGLDADIGYLFQSTPRGYYGLSALTSSGQLHSDFMIEEQWQLFKKMIQLYKGKVHFILVHRELKKAFCRYVNKINDKDSLSFETLRRLYVQPGHHDHFHLRMKCLRDNPRCFQMAELPMRSGC